MNDNAYPIEIRIASKNGWQTPDEARNYYGRYARDGVAIHWWGNGWGADRHDDLVNYELGQAEQGNKSCNYVVSDNKITMLVNPDNVAWCTFEWNPVTVSIEIQPTLSDEGYKKVGWLISQLNERYGKNLWVQGHNQLRPGTTECPGSLNVQRFAQEAVNWANGAYNPAPPPPPAPQPPAENIEWQELPAPVEYICNKQPTNLWNFNQTSWGGFGNPVKQFNQGDKFTAVARGINHKLGSHYLVTKYSFDKRITNGINEADLTLPQMPTPTPVPPNPIPDPIPQPPAPVPTPDPTPTPTPEPTPTPTPEPTPTPTPEPTPQPPDQYPNWFIAFWQKIIDAILKILGKK